MMFNNPELFFDIWHILDDLQKFTFLKAKQIDKNTLLIKNILNQNIDNYIYLSEDKIDFQIIEKESEKQIILISYYSKKTDWMQIYHLPDNCKISLMNSSVIFKNTDYLNFKNMPDCVVEKAKINDLVYLPYTDENLEHDYIGQIKDAVNDENCEVFTLKQNNNCLCFLILTDSISKRFDRKYKYISAIYTLPQYRNMGCAQYLIRSVLNISNNPNFLYISDSDKNLASINLAKKCGFVNIGYNHQFKIEK